MTQPYEKKTVYLALGGNMGNVEKTFSNVCNKLSESPFVHSLRFSKLYQTAPWGVKKQNDFLNLVVEIEWSGSLDNLADLCFSLEEMWGRNREEEVRWGPRTIDIDILVFGNTIINNNRLQIPHPRMHQRRFVLQPLADIQEDFILPGLEKSVADLLKECEDEGKVFPVNVIPWKPSIFKE